MGYPLLEKELPGLWSYGRADPLVHGHASNHARRKEGLSKLQQHPVKASNVEKGTVVGLVVTLSGDGSGRQQCRRGLTAVNVFFRSMYSSRMRPSESNSDSQNCGVTPAAPSPPNPVTDMTAPRHVPCSPSPCPPPPSRRPAADAASMAAVPRSPAAPRPAGLIHRKNPRS